MAVSANEALLVAVFKQLAVTKLDYKVLGEDLGLSREAARNRWVRFQAKIMQSANSNSAVSGGGEMGMPQTPPQTPSPKKKRVSAPKSKTVSSKKRKRQRSEDSDELDLGPVMTRDEHRDSELRKLFEAEAKLKRDEEINALIDRGELW